MKKIVYMLSSILFVGSISTTAYAQEESTDEVENESIVTFTPESEEVAWLIELMDGATPVEEDAEVLFEEVAGADTYLAYSAFYSAPVIDESTQLDDTMVTTTYTLSLVHEDDSILEIERYATDEERNITNPQSYMNSVNTEMYVYNTMTGSFEDFTTSGFTDDDIMIERYDNIYENLEANTDSFEVYENVDYYIYIASEITDLEDQFLSQSGWSRDMLVADTFEYEYIILVNKENSFIEYNGLVTQAENNLDNQSYRTEYYTYYYDQDEYENIDVMYDENAFEYVEEETEEDSEYSEE